MSLNQYVPAFDLYLVFQDSRVKIKYIHEILFCFQNKQVAYKVWVDTANIDHIHDLRSGINFDPVVLQKSGEVQIDGQIYLIDYVSLVYNSRRHEYLVGFLIRDVHTYFENFSKKEQTSGKEDKPLKNRFEVMDMSMENDFR